MAIEPLEHFKCIELHPDDFDRHVPPFAIEGEALADSQAYLQECLNRLKELHEGHCHAEHLLGIRSRMIDRLVVTLFDHFRDFARQKTGQEEKDIVLIAQGGYGRREMNIFSDIDLLFISPKKKGAFLETLTEKLLYVLWDLGMEVGFATRTVPECRKLMGEDVTIMTSLLDIRYLAGSEPLFKELSTELDKAYHSPANRKKFIEKKLGEKRARIEKHGGSVFVLEPNVKESAGGLRDLQTAIWIAQLKNRGDSYEELLDLGLLTEEEYNALIQARNFLWRIRNELHLMVGKKVDLLTFHRQEAIAPRMGFANSEGILGVEKFMQSYYKLAYQAATITETLIRKLTVSEPGISRLFQKLKAKNLDENFKTLDDQIIVKDKKIFKEDPLQMMILFKHVQETGFSIHPETKDHLRAHTHLVDDAFRYNPEAIKLCREMLGQYRNLGHTLFAMHDVHFLDEWFPEFKKLRCRVQHDSYHIYTIDTHSIFAVNELSKLEKGDYGSKFDFYNDVMKTIPRPEMLTLGLFVHDIGKGEGGSHSIKGARIARNITKRLGYTEEEQTTIDFLVLSHLMMPHLSQRRDLEDPELIIQFARSMGTMENLNMLLLLTWGDIRAVGPDAWTDWKGSLLERLYEKTKQVITSGEFSKEKTLERVTRVKEALISKIGDRHSREEFQRYLASMPPRYFFAMSDLEIEQHFLVQKKTAMEDFVMEAMQVNGQNMNEVLIYTLNAPQILSLVTGVLLAFSLNIIGADVFQTNNGHVLVVLRVTDAAGRAINDPMVFDSVRNNLKGVLFGQLRVDELIAKRQIPDYLAKKPVQKAPGKVLVDNDVSAYYTVIDIYAHDRVGLLYDITRTLHQLGCYVDVSKISTKVEQVSDVFYVKDIFGHKITSADKIRSIKKALLEVVNPSPLDAPPPLSAPAQASLQ